MDKHSLAFLIKVRLCRTKGWVTTKMCWKWPRWINYWCWVYVHGYSIVLTEGFKIFQSSVRFSGTCGLEWIRCNVTSPVYHVTDKDHTKTSYSAKGVFIIRVEKKILRSIFNFYDYPLICFIMKLEGVEGIDGGGGGYGRWMPLSYISEL